MKLELNEWWARGICVSNMVIYIFCFSTCVWCCVTMKWKPCMSTGPPVVNAHSEHDWITQNVLTKNCLTLIKSPKLWGGHTAASKMSAADHTDYCSKGAHDEGVSEHYVAWFCLGSLHGGRSLPSYTIPPSQNGLGVSVPLRDWACCSQCIRQNTLMEHGEQSTENYKIIWKQ